MQYDKKKETNPLDTIEHIKNILKSVGIEKLEEKRVPRIIDEHVTESTFLRLQNDMSVTSNGKGTTYEYAMASAYGEFMERLENGNLFSTIAPDRILLTKSELINSDILKYWFNEDLSKIKKYYDFVIDVCCNFGDYATPNEKTAEFLPFYHVNNDDIAYISPHLLQYTGGFTGSCAGNSPEEALTEGLSEVFERHVIRKAIKEPISFPAIPEDIYLKYESINKIVNYCKKLGFNVTVKDCSLGKKYPVTCAVLTDKKTGGYYVWFGAHPYLPISIERCFTEIFQGVDLSNRHFVDALFKFDGAKDNTIPDARMDNAFNHRFLEVNSQFFTKEPDYEFNEADWAESENLSNPQLFNNMILLLLNSNMDVFIRDVSFLNFPAYIICVPALMSTVYNINPESGIDIRNNYYKCVRVLGEDIKLDLTPQEVLDFFTYAYHLQFTINKEYKNLELLHVITLLHTKDYNMALRVVKSLEKTNKYSKYLKLLHMLEEYITGIIDGADINNLKEKLNSKYGKNFTSKIISIFALDNSFRNAVNTLRKGKLYSIKHINKSTKQLKKYIAQNIQNAYENNILNQKEVKRLIMP